MPALAVSIEVVTSVLLWMRIGSRLTTTHNTLGVDDLLIFAAWITGLGLTVAVLLGMCSPNCTIMIMFLTVAPKAPKSLASIVTSGTFHLNTTPKEDW